MKQQKQARIKVVLPVVFTFGAALMFFQGNAYADNAALTTPAEQAQVIVQQSGNMVQSNDSVKLDPSAVAVASNKPVVDVAPAVTTGQYNVTTGPSGASNAGAGKLNVSRLTPAQYNFLSSIHSGAIQTWHQYGVLPSLTASQAIIESQWGESSLAAQYHNLFGIKGAYNGHSVYLQTRENYGGQNVMITAPFRAYDNNAQSIQDHGRFFVDNSRYHNLLWKTNYREVTYLVKADGYATDPNYTAVLNNIIESYGLNAWDQEILDVNTGYIDNISVQGDKLHISGWHVASGSSSNMHHFIILLDGNTNQELYRQDVSKVYRQDIQNIYPNTGAAGWSGFDITIPYTSTFAGRNITVVSRYTNDASGEQHGGRDLFFNPILLNANVAALDRMSLDATTGNINIDGWHAADDILDKNYHYLIIFDASRQTELGRYLITNVARPDVARSFSGLYNAANAGFSLKLQFSPALAGDQIQVISRYTDDPAGNGNRVDYWFAPKMFTANAAYLENFKINGDQLHISGWHAADQSVGKNYHYIIVFDKSTGKEISRYRVENQARPDIARAQANVYNAGQSGFDINVPLTVGMVGDQIQVISRYTDDPAGNGNVIDYWFAPQTFNQNLAHLDQVFVNNHQLNLVGWHATDQSVNKPYHFIILYDWTTGKEVQRQLIEPVTRPDIANAFAIYNAGKSGFKVSLPVDSSLSGHRLQVVSRYSDSTSGEGNHIDYWFKPVSLTIR